MPLHGGWLRRRRTTHISHALQKIEFNGYKLYFANRSELAVLVTNFIFQKAKLVSPFSRVLANCGYKLYFVITVLQELSWEPGN